MSFENLKNAISAAWHGDTTCRLQGIEKRLNDLDGRLPGQEDKKIAGVVGDLLSPSKSDDVEPRIQWRPSFFNGVVSLFILMLIIGGFVFFNSPDDGSFLEYATYALPLFAGFVAGVGFYNKNYEVPAFVISVLCLVGALFLFIRWKHQLLNVGTNLIGLVGIPVALCLIWVINRPALNGKKRYKWERPVAFVVAFLSVLIAAKWTEVMATSDPDWVQVTWRYVVHQHLKHERTTNVAARADIIKIDTPSGAVHFCSVDDFKNMDYLRSKCTQSRIFRGLVNPQNDAQGAP